MSRQSLTRLKLASGVGTMYRGAKTNFRLVHRGCTNRPFYHICVAENFRGVHDQVIEQVGSYDPMLNEHNEHLVALNFDRIQFWLKKGTIATEPVANIFGLAGLFPIPPKLYMKAWRKRARMNNKEAEVAETQTESK